MSRRRVGKCRFSTPGDGPDVKTERTMESNEKGRMRIFSSKC